MFVHASFNDRQALVSLEEQLTSQRSDGCCSQAAAQHGHILQDRQGYTHLRLKLKTMTGWKLRALMSFTIL